MIKGLIIVIGGLAIVALLWSLMYLLIAAFIWVLSAVGLLTFSWLLALQVMVVLWISKLAIGFLLPAKSK